MDNKGFFSSKNFHKIIPQKRNYNKLEESSNKIVEKEKVKEINGIPHNSSPKGPESKNLELKQVDVVAEELLQSKNEREVREYLYVQLLLLDRKKRENRDKEKMKKIINQLSNDFYDLRRCNTCVSRAFNKKAVDLYNLDNRMKKISGDVEKIQKSIYQYEYMGDFYKNKLNELKKNI